MKSVDRRAWSGLAASLLAAVTCRGTEPTLRPSPAGAWQTLSAGLYADAFDQFAAAGNTREAQLGLAIARLNRPPGTPASVEEAEREFARLAQGDDAIAHAAGYLRARLQQLHPMKPDPVAAALEYEQLVATGADDAWCRLALIKLAILRLTVLPAPGLLTERLAAVEPLLARTADVATQHDLHLVIAEVRMNHQIYDAVTLGHLLAALASTRDSDPTRADLLIQVGRVASLVGNRALAQEHYEKFLHDYPGERRVYTVSQALAHLGGIFPP